MSDGRPVDLRQLAVDHQATLYRYAFRLTGKRADAEDLTQQAFLLAQSKLHQLRDAASAKAWLCAILRSCYLQAYRKWTPALETDLRANLAYVPDNGEEPPIDQERLQAGLDGLPAEFKVVVLMFYFEGCSYREIAEKLELPLGTVMSRLSRAKQHLRAALFEPEMSRGCGGR
jgi:RNA polymerase sigma-70 factor (ECF subfamily)